MPRFCSFYHTMYRPTESVGWCQCCQRGVSLPYAEGSPNLFGNDDSPQIVNSSDNASCFHISFSFSVADQAPLCKGGWQKSLISDWGIVLYRCLTIPPSRLRRATPRPLLSASQTFSPLTGKSTLCTREAFVPTIILQITMLLFVKPRRFILRI